MHRMVRSVLFWLLVLAVGVIAVVVGFVTTTTTTTTTTNNNDNNSNGNNNNDKAPLRRQGRELEQQQQPKRDTVVAPTAMVASSHATATDIALAILQEGGNAADAGVAIQFALSVIQPQSTGLGGGCVILYYDASSGEVVALDGREEAPTGFHGRQFCKNNDCLTNPDCNCDDGLVDSDDMMTGGHPVGTPGIVHSTLRFLEDYGTMPRQRLIQPAMDLARNGFPMYERLYDAIINAIDRLSLFDSSSELFLSPDRTRPICELGELFYNPDIEHTLSLLVDQGADLFYTGEVAEAIVNTTKSYPNPNTEKYGLLTMEDLEMYLSVYRQPVTSTYRGKKIYGFGSATSGSVVVMEMLNLLEAYDLSLSKQHSVEALHRMADVQHAAFADRDKYLADPDWVDVPIAGLLDKTYALDRREELFSAFRASVLPIAPGTPEGASKFYASVTEDHEKGTTHWCIVDAEGNALSWTSTVEANLGAALVVPGYGFLLNNELTDFEHYESDENGVPYANAAAGDRRQRRTALRGEDTTYGGKRPRSSMAPLLVFNNTGDFYMSIGSPGGSSIPGGVLNVFVNVVDFHMDLQEATDIPRVIGKNQYTSVEEGICEVENGTVYETLLARGFSFNPLVPTTATFGRVQTVYSGQDGYLYGASDVLRESQGGAGGY